MAEMVPEPTPCRCRKHQAGAFIARGEHVFTRDQDEVVTVGDDLINVWRWGCSCGRRGHWTAESSDAAYHGWLRHAGVG